MGIYPALQGSHVDLIDGLKEGGRGTKRTVCANSAFAKILVGAQVALSITLLVGAALLITSFHPLESAKHRLPFPESLTGAITLPSSQYPDRPSRQRFVEQTCMSCAVFPARERDC